MFTEGLHLVLFIVLGYSTKCPGTKYDHTSNGSEEEDGQKREYEHLTYLHGSGIHFSIIRAHDS